MYVLKQAPCTWCHHFATYLRLLGFIASVSDTSLFVYKDGDSIVYLLLYVDDIVLTASSVTLQRIIERLHAEFSMTDLGRLHHFLGICHAFARWPVSGRQRHPRHWPSRYSCPVFDNVL